MKQAQAVLRYLRIAPRKVRLVTDSIKKLTVNEAEAQLLMRNKRAAQPILKLLRSAIANAKNKNLNSDNLVISVIKVDGGPMLKRFMPRARGRATPIQKKTSHVTLILTETTENKPSRFNVLPPVKKDKKSKERKQITKPKAVPKVEAIEKDAKEQPGFFKKMFRRKSV